MTDHLVAIKLCSIQKSCEYGASMLEHWIKLPSTMPAFHMSTGSQLACSLLMHQGRQLTVGAKLGVNQQMEDFLSPTLPFINTEIFKKEIVETYR